MIVGLSYSETTWPWHCQCHSRFQPLLYRLSMLLVLSFNEQYRNKGTRKNCIISVFIHLQSILLCIIMVRVDCRLVRWLFNVCRFVILLIHIFSKLYTYLSHLEEALQQWHALLLIFWQLSNLHYRPSNISTSQ